MDFYKAKNLGLFVDYKEYMKEYDACPTDIDKGGHSYILKRGAPLVKNIEGFYIKFSDIKKLTRKRKYYEGTTFKWKREK